MIIEKDRLALIKSILQSITVIIILIISSLTVIYFLHGNTKGTVYTNLGLSGDFIGGILGTIISLLSLIYLVSAFRLQKRELEETKKYLHKQQFESTFFKMLDMINIIGNDLKIEDSENKPILQGNMFYRKFFNMMTANYKFEFIEPYSDLKNYHFTNFVTSHINNTDPDKSFYKEKPMWGNDNAYHVRNDFDVNLTKAWKEEHDKEFCGIVYTYSYERFDTQLGHLFRYIYNAMQFVINECKTDVSQQKIYINFIQAQLSNYQLVIMFYSGVSKTSFSIDDEAKFHTDADKFEIFQNLNGNLLFDPEHYKFYPNTHFKFRNGVSYNEEIMNKN
ncbi:MAG: putative phage abortive infection protein [Bacteroidota bacterium]